MTITPPRDPSDADIFERLKGLIAACGSRPNKHDLATVLIEACIEEGIDTGPRIIGALSKLGLKAGHVGIMLKNGTGAHPTGYRWQRASDGRYSLIDQPAG